MGTPSRYNGGAASLGQSAWLYDGATTLNIGLTGSEQTRNDGYQSNYSQQLNEAGQVIGYAERYNGGNTYLGQDAWVYDPILGTVALQLSVRDDGYAYSNASFLGEDGLVLGSYNLYSGLSLVGQRAFYWSAADGLWDLGILVTVVCRPTVGTLFTRVSKRTAWATSTDSGWPPACRSAANPHSCWCPFRNQPAWSWRASPPAG